MDIGSETANSSLARPEMAKVVPQAAKSGQQQVVKPGQQTAKTDQRVGGPGLLSSTTRSDGSLSVDSLSGSSLLGGKPIFSETNMQSSLGYLP